MTIGGDGPGDRGLTLIEMLVVLAILAVATGASLLSVGARRGDATAATARHLAAAIQAAADRSLATGATALLVTARDGYGLGADHIALPVGTTVAGTAPTMRVAFGGEPFALLVAHGGDRWTVAFDGVEAVATPGSLP